METEVQEQEFVNGGILRNKNLVIAVGGALAAFLFITFLNLIKNSEAIWLANRLFGMTAYFSLFITVLLGELRLLSKVKGSFAVFRFHKPVAIFSTFLVLMHGLSAVVDKYKWGKTLSFVDYLGFNFSDKWMVFLSFGTLAFYFMLLTGVTSATKGIQILGFKRWKAVHYFSYISFIFGYVHAINLGTDIKTGMAAFLMFPLFKFTFLIVAALFLVRISKGFGIFADQWEINLACIFSVLLLLVSSSLIANAVERQQLLDAIDSKMSLAQLDIKAEENYNKQLVNETMAIRQQIGALENG